MIATVGPDYVREEDGLVVRHEADLPLPVMAANAVARHREAQEATQQSRHFVLGLVLAVAAALVGAALLWSMTQ